MEAIISDITYDELQVIIEKTVEKKIYELLDDEDLGMKLNDTVKKRLRQQIYTVINGNNGKKLDAVIDELGIK